MIDRAVTRPAHSSQLIRLSALHTPADVSLQRPPQDLHNVPPVLCGAYSAAADRQAEPGPTGPEKGRLAVVTRTSSPLQRRAAR